jgi:hypothetical protein
MTAEPTASPTWVRSLNPNLEIAVLSAVVNADGPVPRAELRALLPPYRNPRASRNISKGFGSSLRRWARAGWIERTETHIRVLDREALQVRLTELQQPRKSVAEDIEQAWLAHQLKEHS